MPMDDYDLTESIPISAFKNSYPVRGPYKGHKKTSDGKPLPFESIDISLYKKQANCVCFITNEKRIHAWIKALLEIIYLQYGDSEHLNVTWRDHVDDIGSITSTEFLLSDHNEEKFKYKVFVYITTGNIMVQGNSFKQFCEDEFDKCVSKVNEILHEDS